MTNRILVVGVAIATLVTAATFASQSATTDYFPSDAFGHAGNDIDAKALSLMGEPGLAATGSEDLEVYRFLWAPSFHAYAVVRVERTGTRVALFAKRLNRDLKTGEFAKLDRSAQKMLSEKQWQTLKSRLSAARFWSMPSDEPETYSPGGILRIGLDGADWILEGADTGRHHGVKRWFHEDERAFETACYCMLLWSGLDKALDDVEQYGTGTRRRLAWACSAGPVR
jgi:hypothetical protein